MKNYFLSSACVKYCVSYFCWKAAPYMEFVVGEEVEIDEECLWINDSRKFQVHTCFLNISPLKWHTSVTNFSSHLPRLNNFSRSLPLISAARSRTASWIMISRQWPHLAVLLWENNRIGRISNFSKKFWICPVLWYYSICPFISSEATSQLEASVQVALRQHCSASTLISSQPWFQTFVIRQGSGRIKLPD